MTLTKEQIKDAALQLGPGDRAALAEELLLSVNGTQRDEIDAAWLEEVRNRDMAYCAPGTSLPTTDQVISRLRNKVRS